MVMRRWKWPTLMFRFLKTEDWSTLSLDFVKFLVSGLGFGIVLLGYSYSHSFFRSFGLSLFQLDLSTIDIAYRGIALIVLPWIAIFFPMAIVVSALLLAIRSHLHQIIGLVVASFAVTILTVGILLLGQNTGEQHAKSIWAEGGGKKVFCRFHVQEKDPLNELLPVLNKLAIEERLRLVHLGKDITYLAPVLQTIPVGRTTGESYAVPTALLRFCRIVGS